MGSMEPHPSLDKNLNIFSHLILYKIIHKTLAQLPPLKMKNFKED